MLRNLINYLKWYFISADELQRIHREILDGIQE